MTTSHAADIGAVWDDPVVMPHRAFLGRRSGIGDADQLIGTVDQRRQFYG
jgi:hypothetical protein